ncbi:MAG: histidinol-phosphate transaminase [Candidatus Nanopelagicales bacterium]
MPIPEASAEQWPPVRDDLLHETPYGAPQIDVPVRLNTNENPYGPSPELAQAMGAAVASAALSLHRYPDRDARELRQALAAYVTRESHTAVSADNVWAANGSNEVMAQIFSAFGGPGRTALTFTPTYSMYGQYARDSHTGFIEVARQANFALDADQAASAIGNQRPSLVVLTSPNNPTGTSVPLRFIETVCAATDAIVVVDEAYAEFRRQGTPSAVSLLTKYRHLIVTRTMSKAFAFAGGRLGYAVGHPRVIEALQLVRLPYHLSQLSQVIAQVALEHSDELLGRVSDLRTERDALLVWLRDNGFTALDSDANFILFGCFDDSHAVWQALLDHGVLIRESGPPGWLRVSIGTAAQNEIFREALLLARGASGMISHGTTPT